MPVGGFTANQWFAILSDNWMDIQHLGGENGKAQEAGKTN